MKDYSKDPNYICKSKINSKIRNELGIPDYVSINELKENFDMCDYKTQKTGNSLNKNQQRHTKFVYKKELRDMTIKGHTRLHKR